ncbi:hypothetical protein CC80DRAFT_132457 [Byssothecium circinans]|uniref:DUF7703 domain-containing protein n=1 Tax=Byssothecium circinans TaxID=147558 RepID=A0A6A5TQ98_9PLEO|nr:hypothetical protein CC80DRAFT_132457 [Byssothecium circinans]
MAGNHGEALETGVSVILACFLAIAVYNVLELFVLIFTTFNKWQGFYFYSVLAATSAIIPHNIGIVLKLYKLSSSNILFNTLILFGWVGMVSGQSLVLYSRLHLLNLRSPQRSRWVLYMIIFDGLICHVSGFVLVFGSANAPNPKPYQIHFTQFEQVQLCIFFTQECIISGLYIYKAFKLLKSGACIRGLGARRLLRHLLAINVIIMALDVSLLAVEFAEYYSVETAYKSFVYSVKLKLEFAVLNDLINIFRLDPSQAGSAATTATSVPSSRPRLIPSTSRPHVQPSYRSINSGSRELLRPNHVAFPENPGSDTNSRHIYTERPNVCVAHRELPPSTPLDTGGTGIAYNSVPQKSSVASGISSASTRRSSKSEACGRVSAVSLKDEGLRRVSSECFDGNETRYPA